MRLSVIEGSQETLVDLINPDRPEIFAVEDPLLGPMVSTIIQFLESLKSSKTLKGVNFEKKTWPRFEAIIGD